MRRYDLDSLRVIAFALLIFYHVGMFFVPWWFHIKNNVIYDDLKIPMLFFNQWRLSLLFIISGMGTFYALSKRTARQFAFERIKRLFIPLVFGILFIVPPQIYIERLAKGQFQGYYFEFWPSQMFNGLYPEGNFSWHHLWFILYLLIFSLILIPLFQYLKQHPDTCIIRKIKHFATKPWGLYILIIPLFLWRVLLEHRFPQTNALINDWYNLINYGTLFFYGFLLISLKDTFWQAVVKNRYIYLAGGIIGFSAMLCLWYLIGDFTFRGQLNDLIRSFNAWSWILALIGFSAAYLNKPSKKLAYANEAVYPFYILHQTITIIIGYYLMNVNMGFFPKFAIMVIGTFGGCWIIYEFCIRRFKLIRPLFGMKPDNHSKTCEIK